eukprot:PhF_6_TR25588/c1_g1_i10/m.35893
MLMISFLVLTVLLIAPLQTNAQRCLSPTSYDTTLVLVTNTSNTDIDCLGSTSLNLRQLDAMPEYTPCSVNSTWGPYSVLFPKANIPSQCNPVTWARKRAVEVAANIVSKKYNYCHHHTATWTPPNDTVYRSVSDPCGSEEPIDSKCSSLGLNLTLPFNGVDCSHFTSMVYNYGFGIRINTNIDNQACGPDAPGVTLPYTINDVLNTSPSPLLPGDLLYTGASGTPANVEVTHVVMWTGIQMDLNNASSPYSREALLAEMPTCQQSSQQKFITNRLAAGLPVYVIADSHGTGPRFRAFAGWYVSAFTHARRIIDAGNATFGGSLPTLNFTSTNGCVAQNVVKYNQSLKPSPPPPSTVPPLSSPSLAPSSSTRIVFKKGMGISKAFGASQLLSLNTTWYYNWGISPHIPQNDNFEFVPMMWSGKRVNDTIPQGSRYLLGFNEPDFEEQSNMTVAAALALWPWLLASAKKLSPTPYVSAPVTARDPINGTWLPNFIRADPPPYFDFVCLHWYKGPNAAKFISDVQNLISAYRRPVWVTEFAPQTNSSSTSEPDKYTQEQVNSFIRNVTAFMESEPMVHRYAWHTSAVGTSALFKADGSLTLTGEAYAAVASTIAPSPTAPSPPPPSTAPSVAPPPPSIAPSVA